MRNIALGCMDHPNVCIKKGNIEEEGKDDISWLGYELYICAKIHSKNVLICLSFEKVFCAFFPQLS